VVGADRCVRRHRCLLTIASIFIAQALDKPLSISEQISVLVFMLIASRAAAGVTGAGLAVLAGGLHAHRRTSSTTLA
jgi:aerobic C4-dicarboxylate transport protein